MPRILIVEDNEFNADMLVRRLRRQGFTTLLATQGEEGITLAKSAQPDLILMDMSLPILDGWEATRRLKQDEATAHIPVIGFSAHAMMGDRERAIAAGCDEYDTKPIEFSRLLTKIIALLPADASGSLPT